MGGCFGCSGVLGIGVLLVVGAAAGAAGGAYWTYVIDDPGPHLDRDHILATIAQESPVYYRDGTTRLGVFFEGEHRELVPYDSLPPAFVVSLIAAEDGGYWSHPGVDIVGITRAMRDNVQAGRIVSGGSTLSQQTAKNLFERPDRSLKAKGQELLDAARLEAHYSKREILAFYANQFHVSGNGRGLGIGARYFFDKEGSELDLLESAFLAGLVKGPANYDPFLGSAERQAKNLDRAHTRTRYVLGRLVAEDAESLAEPLEDPAQRAAAVAAVRALQADADRLLAEGFALPFKRGTFRYDSNALLDEVRIRLSEAPFDAVFAAAGIQDPATAGLQVITTLDPITQREAIYSLWHHLTDVGTKMEALGPEAFVRADSKGPAHDARRVPRVHTFSLAKVVGHPKEGKRTALDLDLGGPTCRVDANGVARVATASRRGTRGSNRARPTTTQVDAFADALAVDAIVWVSIRSVDLDDNGKPTSILCDLEVRPELQGATVVVQHGQIRAMVGGNDHRNFNRATALRQFGSTWKPLVYQAALTLGWRPDSAIDNSENFFQTGGSVYWPGAAHTPAPQVSISWAGVHSENLGSVWLTQHLTDPLDTAGAAALAAKVDLAPRPGEPNKAWRERMSKLGLTPTAGQRERGRFFKAKQKVLLELEAAGDSEQAVQILNLPFGGGLDAERKKQRRKADRVKLMERTWVRLQHRAAQCRAQAAVLAESWSQGQVPHRGHIPDLSGKLDQGRVRIACGTIPEGYGHILPTWLPQPEVEEDEGGRTWSTEAPTWGQAVPSTGGSAALDSDVYVDGIMRLQTIERLQRAISEVSAREPSDPWAPENVYSTPNFRERLGLRAVARLANTYGVQTPIQEVLSMSLGATEVTLEEMTLVYEGLVSGQAWSYPGSVTPPDAPFPAQVDSPNRPGLLIAEIRDIDGNTLYKAEPKATQVVPPEVAAETADILRNVVRHGTGRRAAKLLVAGGSVVPLGGKTGTTNSFRNAAFLGFAPAWTPQGFDPIEGPVVGVYVGYDDNRPMRNKGIALSGASGALPAWMGTVKGADQAGLLGKVDRKKRGGWPLVGSQNLTRVSVDGNGLPMLDGAGQPVTGSLAGRGVAVAADDVRNKSLEQLILRQRLPAPNRDSKPEPGGGLWSGTQ
ncbi:MAG: transglycosylase domain-containing protein [Myxococcota bacterium]